MKQISVFLLLFSLFYTQVVFAQNGQPEIPRIETIAKQAILVEEETGDVLMEKNADEKMPTSSMSKVMTMYLVFEALRDGKVKIDDEVTVSEHAWKQEGSRTFLNVGQKVKLIDLIRGVIVQSGNDAAVALAEAIAGSEEKFAEMMNDKAEQLGLSNTHFMNSSGLPQEGHYSTARDLAKLAIATIRDFPEYYHYYSEKEFTYNNIKQGNRNPLLYRDMGVDGLKTGHAEEAGFGLIASAERDGRRLVLVVNGLKNMQERADESAKIIEWGYREFGLYPFAQKGKKFAEAKVWLGKLPKVSLVAGENFIVSLPRSVRKEVKAKISYEQPVHAPITKGQTIGKIEISIPDREAVFIPLVTGEEVEQLGFFHRIKAKIDYLMGKN